MSSNDFLSKAKLDDPRELADAIARLLDSKKGRDVTIIDLSGRTIIADYFVIASATSTTGVKSLADYVVDELERYDIRPLHADIDAKWIALDYSAAIVHIFYDELREFYSIERLWADGKNIKLYRSDD